MALGVAPGQAWLGWAPHLATVRISLRQNYKYGQARSKCLSILWVLPAPGVGWRCTFPDSQSLALPPRNQGVRLSWFVHSQAKHSLQRSSRQSCEKATPDVKTNSTVSELKAPLDIS